MAFRAPRAGFEPGNLAEQPKFSDASNEAALRRALVEEAEELRRQSTAQSDAPDDSLPQREGGRFGWRADVLRSGREQKFFEMECGLPVEHGPACFLEVRERIQTRHPEATRHSYRDFFADVQQPIVWQFEGRPHRGTLHSLKARQLGPLCPRWEGFQRARERLDPKGRLKPAALPRLRDARLGAGGAAEEAWQRSRDSRSTTTGLAAIVRGYAP